MNQFYKSKILFSAKLKHLIKIICLTFYLSFVFQHEYSKASHVAGAELTYTCIDSIHYVFTYTLYGNCYGFINDTIEASITNQCGWLTYYPKLALVEDPIDLDVTCATDTSNCSFGPYLGIRKCTYVSDTVNLFYKCRWTISVGISYRLIEMTTLSSPASPDLIVTCMIDNTAIGQNNNSPIFINDPALFYCVNQPLIIESGVTEIDGDSIIYSLTAPRFGLNQSDTVTYASGYSSVQPLQCNSPMVFDSLSGTFFGTPISNDVSAYAVLVSEYRNGLLIGQVERDAAIFVDNCNNIYPSLAGINGMPFTSLTVQANQQNYFQIASVDANSSNTTTIEYDSSIAGMSFFFSRGQRDTAFFSWMPTYADTAQNPHCFTLKVKDDNCPYPGVKAERYCLNVSTIVGINNVEEREVLVYPNPFDNEINFRSSIQEKVTVRLFDFQRRLLLGPIVTESNGSLKIDFVKEGIYLLSITGEKSGQTFWKRVVKNK